MTTTQAITEAEATRLAKRYQAGYDSRAMRDADLQITGRPGLLPEWRFTLSTDDGQASCEIIVDEHFRRVRSNFGNGSFRF